MKCLYKNMKHKDYALVINYREKGENYQATLGSESRLIHSAEEFLENIYNLDIDLDDEFEEVPVKTELICGALRLSHYRNSNSDSSCLNLCQNTSRSLDHKGTADENSSFLHRCIFQSFPSIQELSRWQYDFNLRRAGFQGTWESLLLDNITDSLEEDTQPNSIHFHHIFHMLEQYVDRNVLGLELFGSKVSRQSIHNGSTERLFKRFAELEVVADSELCRSFENYFLPLTNTSCGKLSSLQHTFQSELPRADMISVDTVKTWVSLAQILVVDVRNSINNDVERSFVELRPHMQSLKFILVVDNSCLSAPTWIGDELKSRHASRDAEKRYFGAVESVCSEKTDAGAVLFERINRSVNLQSNLVRRKSSIRRLPGNIVHRRFF
jgi:hypothetical protein